MSQFEFNLNPYQGKEEEEKTIIWIFSQNSFFPQTAAVSDQVRKIEAAFLWPSIFSRTI
jgi:hypothetical protein